MDALLWQGDTEGARASAGTVSPAIAVDHGARLALLQDNNPVDQARGARPLNDAGYVYNVAQYYRDNRTAVARDQSACQSRTGFSGPAFDPRGIS